MAMFVVEFIMLIKLSNSLIYKFFSGKGKGKEQCFWNVKYYNMEGYDNYHNKLNIYIKIELFYVIISIFDFLFSTVREIE